jgi:hypothetical protein
LILSMETQKCTPMDTFPYHLIDKQNEHMRH